MSRLADAATHQTASLETSISRQVCRACLAGGLLALLCAGAVPASAQGTASPKAAPLDLSSGDTGWVSAGGEWIAKPGSPPPVGSDPAHPYVPNNTGKQPTFRIADLTQSQSHPNSPRTA